MKKLRKGIVYLITLAIMLSVSPISTTSAFAAPNYANSSNQGISTYSHEIIWVYKIENGIMYKRQYNTTTGKYIGDWIPMS